MAIDAEHHVSIVSTKLQPPLLGLTVLHRPRLDEWLERVRGHRATLVVAAAGYGKTTMLGELAAGSQPLLWYTLSSADSDPVLFLAHLIEGARSLSGGARGYSRLSLDISGRSVEQMQAALVELLVRQDAGTTIVIEDVHAVNEDQQLVRVLDWLLRHAPRNVRFVLSSRLRPRLPFLPKLRASKQLLSIDEQVLRFTSVEVKAFMQSRGIFLSDDEVRSLTDQTEGWVLGLQLAEQFLSSGGAVADFRAQQGQREDLFEYLAEEVLDKQMPEVRDFMTRSSVLRVLQVPAVNLVLGTSEGAEWLRYLEDRNLFVLRLDPESVRYHHLVADFLQKRLRRDPRVWRELNRNAAQYHEQAGQHEAAFSHWVEAADFDAAGRELLRLVPQALTLGRLSAALAWFAVLPSEVQRATPILLLYKAQVLQKLGRLHAAFDTYSEAAELLERAGDLSGLVSALRGKATIYRDKGAHQRATELYETALKHIEPEDLHSRAALLSQLAVNDAAVGELVRAEEQLYSALDLYTEARDAHGQVNVWNNIAQVLRIRQGRFDEAIHAAQIALQMARQLGSPLLEAEAQSTIATVLFLEGEYGPALEAATATQLAGMELRAANLIVDALITMGHILRHGTETERRAADEAYAEAFNRLAASDSQHYLGIEALLGSSALRRLRGDHRVAWNLSRQALEASMRRRHDWFSLVCKLEHATCTLEIGDTEAALDLLRECEQGFRRYQDTYHLASVYLYLAAGQSDTKSRDAIMGLCIELVEQGQHYALLARESRAALPLLIGTLAEPNRRESVIRMLLRIGSDAVPVLLETLDESPREVQKAIVGALGALGDERARKALRRAVSNKHLKAEAESALAQLIPRPEYTLALRLLGTFEVRRGDQKVGDREWRTARARSLLQLLVSHRGSYVPKERILEMLWPDLDEDAADNNFRFTLSSLNKALEPHRGEGANPYYIQRRGESYGLDPEADVWVDVEEFERAVRLGRSAQRHGLAKSSVAREAYRRAVDLYTDDYLPEQVYEDWTSSERERLRELYFHAAGSLAEMLLHDARYEEVIELARAVLQKDPCREDAYRLLMRAHHRKGDRTAAIRAYQGCVAALDRELGVAPLPETQQLYETLRATGR